MSLCILGNGGPVQAQEVAWRFGFEDTWSQLAGFMSDEQKGMLLEKLGAAVAAQPAGGDININGTAGGWGGMQPSEGDSIDFSQSDRLVQLLQAHGFSMLWNLRINAPWSSENNAGCYNRSTSGNCAPDEAHEEALYEYVYALVERYDGDGVRDMGYETPGDTSDDLQVPMQFYLMVGEIEFAGATPPPDGYGDAADRHFWHDTIDNLLRTHRIVYRAVHDADPSGFSKLVSSGGIFWDLYGDFPDWPAIEGPTVQARLNGENNHDAVYVESFDRLKQMLTSFGDDADGIEADYVGWHPHMPWRGIEQAFTFIHTYAGDVPIYVDDMWCNIFLQDREDAPGNTLFTGGGQAIEGDFPNELAGDYTELRNGVIFNNPPEVRSWYEARHARTIVKAFTSAFGEGAERVSISGIADFAFDRLSLTGHINILGTLDEDFAEKPGYYTYQLLVDKLHDFTDVEERPVSDDPRTRAYRFERAERGPVYVLWSETGEAPPDLDYRVPTGETVTLDVESDTVRWTHLVTDREQPEPRVDEVVATNGQLTMQLGYEPVILEPVDAMGVGVERTEVIPGAVALDPNYPNPFAGSTTIRFRLRQPTSVRLEVIDVLGRTVRVLVDELRSSGGHAVVWDGRDHTGTPVAGGVYLYRVTAGVYQETRRLLVLH